MSRFSIIMYVLLFIALLAHPHFITGHAFNLPQAYAQSATTLLLSLIAFVIFIFNKRDLKKREKENTQLVQQIEHSNDKLNDAWQYIGRVNRKLPLIHSITTNLLIRPKHTKNHRKAIFKNILNIAITSVSRSDHGMLRFVEVSKQRTVREFGQTKYLRKSIQKISNKALINQPYKNQLARLPGGEAVIVSSDDTIGIKCFLILPKKTKLTDETHLELKAIVDQALIFHQFLYKNNSYNKPKNEQIALKETNNTARSLFKQLLTTTSSLLFVSKSQRSNVLE